MKRHFAFLGIIIPCILALFCAGCGGKNGDAISSGPFKGGIVPVRITRSSGMSDAIFGYAGGDGVSGGWIEHPEGSKLLHSDFIIDNINMWYQITLSKNVGSFVNGDYYLKYTQGGETKTLAFQNLSWTMLQRTWYDNVPRYEYRDRQLIVSFTQIPASGQVKYYIRLLDPSMNYVIYEGYPQTNTVEINEVISQRNDVCELHLMADVYENDVLKSRYIHLFTNVELN